MPHATQLVATESALLVVDVQTKLMAKIPGADAVVQNIGFLVDGAKLLDVPVVATEQYPKGLGSTVPELLRRLPERPDKVAFSCCAVQGLTDGLRSKGVTRVVLAGIETHVCVLNTALDLLAEGFWVYLAVDSVASRFAVDHEAALRRLEGAGVILTTAETTIFEWTGGAQHPKFKQISALIQERMRPV